ncbi:IS110 family RNA-guided transposase [Novipirellula artificiosorum]|uniref:Transposase IS116/IS110/IS902 family protein n=1 Tax=Novipirellula artificiosorum TaxID=2528016 RepID=A0A5C6CTR3_9BACT|nr:IS110 family transposase [Novipirellula artificiosorum]TWU28000.1 Transposase IS116/IS110/IS902 family protein [Novipirellula artificiosorum]
MKILALDLGKFNTMCCFFDTKTRKSRFLTTPTERQHIASVLKNAKVDLVVMEACGPSGWINDLAQSLDHATLVCSTNEEAWQWAKVKRKTDKDDALKLARLAAMRELKPVHMPSQTHREFRSLVKYRKTLDRRINKTKNTIRAWFVNQGITIDSGDKAWHTGREHINSFRKPIQDCGPDELWKGELDIELTILDSLTQQIDTVVKKLEAIGKTEPRIVRLMTIPGVGPRTAEILVACLDDPHRFETSRQVSAYFGLVPRQYQSGETDRNGRITKRGNPLARTILVECAWASLRYNPWAKGVYERICGKQKTRKKKAGIALARKIAVISWAMLRDEKDWEPKRMIEVTESYGRMSPALKETLQTMKPKENADQRKSRLRKEAREARAAADHRASETDRKSSKTSTISKSRSTKQVTTRRKTTKTTATRSSHAASKPRRAGKLVRVTDAMTSA